MYTCKVFDPYQNPNPGLVNYRNKDGDYVRKNFPQSLFLNVT